MNNRRCNCGITHGITIKGFNWSKIMQCDEHGLICPFDSWQFKTADELMNHFDKEQSEPLSCEGNYNYGKYGMVDAIFELEVFRSKLLRNTLEDEGKVK